MTEFKPGEKPEPLKIVMPSGQPAQTQTVYTNAMGHQKIPINHKHEELIRRIRDTGLELYVLLHEAGGTNPNEDRFANRSLAIAATDLQTVIMWAVRGVCDRK